LVPQRESFESNILKLVGIKPVHSTLIGMSKANPATGQSLLQKLAELGARGD
jgi:hypothetical protein